MPTIRITDSEGVVVTGQTPRSWADVSLKHYTALANAADWPARCRALADLCGLPAQPLLDDVSLCLPILRTAPFLMDGPLPLPGTPPDSFRHLGVTYIPAPADLEKVNAEQLEGLLAFLSEHEGNTLAAAPHLLAVLYKPAGGALTADTVEASAAAFASLPMALGYALLLDFTSRSEKFALPIQRYLAVRPVVEQVLNALETLSPPSASPARCWNLPRWLLARWIQHVKKALK